ncbi:MAG TPA: hypothetical protein ENJ06_06060 [Phycisphaeraceae bacterium]|nr:hypothetical protein [Phycisphaeraceae bacterium]
MAMNFFEHQHRARKRTTTLIVLFALAVIGIIAALDLLGLLIVSYTSRGHGGNMPPGNVHFAILTLSVLFTLLIVGGGSISKTMSLRAGGKVVAESLGGKRILEQSADPVERRVLNVVEEMAIASGTPVPPVYILDHERGINAFAAGFSPNDAVVSVTRGCAETLTRDELQGVIGHEFSHILNGDMRLNIRLIGVLHGILLIGMIGYFILRISFYSGAGYRSSSNNRKGGNPLPLIGIGLIIIGFIGTFFGNWIKAAVSRQREFLADASSVQFTRNPDGIAGALKKIGGYTYGSKIENPNAPQASHMFFGQAITSGLAGLFATHPPLPERIKRIDPTWDGKFPRVTGAAAQTGDTVSGGAVSGAAAFAGGAAAQHSPVGVSRTEPAGTPRTRHFADHVGNPTEEHVKYARALIGSLPDYVAQAARDPYGARAVIYCLLLDSDEKVRARQLETLNRQADAGVLRETEKLYPLISNLKRELRLPLIDMAMPALRALSVTQYAAFKNNVAALVAADSRIDLFEWSLNRILTKHLGGQFEGRRVPGTKYYNLNRLGSQCSLLLSMLAYVGSRDEDQAREAFSQAAKYLPVPGLRFLSLTECSLEALGSALDELVLVAPKLKEKVIAACTACICADREVTTAEAEVLRAVSDTLDCPMPPLLPGETLAS